MKVRPSETYPHWKDVYVDDLECVTCHDTNEKNGFMHECGLQIECRKCDAQWSVPWEGVLSE